MRPSQPLLPLPIHLETTTPSTLTQNTIKLNGAWAGATTKLIDKIKTNPHTATKNKNKTPTQTATPTPTPTEINIIPIYEVGDDSDYSDQDYTTRPIHDDSSEESDSQLKWEQEQKELWAQMEQQLESQYDIHFHFFKIFKKDWFLANYNNDFTHSHIHQYDREWFFNDAVDYFDYFDYFLPVS